MLDNLNSINNIQIGKIYKTISDNEEYYLLKENMIYKINILKRKSDIKIICDNYHIIINNNDLSLILNIRFNSNEEVYNFFINNFHNKNVLIKDLIINLYIKLIFKVFIFNKEKDLEIVLLNKNVANNNNVSSEVVNNGEEKYVININETNPRDICFSNDLIRNAYSYYTFLDNTFSVFKSTNDVIYLIYSNINKSIISFNVIDNKKINEIKNAHKEYITNFRYYFDKNHKRDLIISISSDDNNIKLWNIFYSECLLDLRNVNKFGNLYSACFLNYNNEIFIVSSNYNYYGDYEPIKIYDMNCNKIKEIDDSEDQTYFLDTFNDNKTNIAYIIAGNKNSVKSYNYNKNEIYHIYDDNSNKGHYSIILYKKNNIINLIETSEDKNIRIWDFHSCELIKKIKISKNYCLNGLCIWDDKYLFVGCYDKAIKLIDLDNGIIIKNLNNHTSRVLTVKKINHSEYGECLISQGWDEKIKLWVKKK